MLHAPQNSEMRSPPQLIELSYGLTDEEVMRLIPAGTQRTQDAMPLPDVSDMVIPYDSLEYRARSQAWEPLESVHQLAEAKRAELQTRRQLAAARREAQPEVSSQASKQLNLSASVVARAEEALEEIRSIVPRPDYLQEAG